MHKKSAKLKIIRSRLEQGSLLLPAIAYAGVKSPYTLNLWRKPEGCRVDRYIKACIEKCENRRVQIVEDALLKAAAEGNTTAMIFFLTNRRSDRWADRRAVVNNTIVNKVGGNGSFIGQDAELQKRVRSDLLRFMPE